MPILGPHPTSTQSEILGKGLQCFHKLPGNSDTSANFKIAALLGLVYKIVIGPKVSRQNEIMKTNHGMGF